MHASRFADDTCIIIQQRNPWKYKLTENKKAFPSQVAIRVAYNKR